MICRSFQANDGMRLKNSCAKSAQKPISCVSCLSTEKRITSPSIRKPGGCSVIRNFMVRG